MTDGVSRRRFIAALGAGAVTGALAGCGYRPGGGDVRWETRAGSGTSPPEFVVPAGETLFAVDQSRRTFDFDTHTWGEAGTVTAYDGRTGAERWQTSLAPLGRPAVHGETLYVGHEAEGLRAFGTDGTVRWRIPVGSFPRDVAATAERVYAVSTAGDLTAFETGDGDEVWEREVGSGERTVESGERTVDGGERYALAASDEAVFVTADGGAGSLTVTAIARDGTHRWSRERPGRVRSAGAHVVHGETVYVATDRRLLALAVDDGSKRWSRPGEFTRGPPVVSNETVYYAAGDTLYALDTSDGEEQWTFGSGTRHGAGSPPAVAGDTVYVGGGDEFSALAADDGSVRWQVGGEQVVDAFVVGQTAVAVTESGRLRCHWRE